MNEPRIDRARDKQFVGCGGFNTDSIPIAAAQNLTASTARSWRVPFDGTPAVLLESGVDFRNRDSPARRVYEKIGTRFLPAEVIVQRERRKSGCHHDPDRGNVSKVTPILRREHDR